METTTTNYNTIITPDQEFEIRKREFELQERTDKLKVENGNLLIKKAESLLDILESVVPSSDNNNIMSGDKYNYVSIFTEKELETVKNKLFKIIEKY